MEVLCLGLSIVFAWSVGLLLVGLAVPRRRHPAASRRRRFAVLVCARNEEAVVRLPVSSALACVVRLCIGDDAVSATWFFLSVVAFVVVMGWFTAVASVALSPKRNRPSALAVLTFPVFSLVLAATVLYTLLRPTRSWKPIPHRGGG